MELGSFSDNTSMSNTDSRKKDTILDWTKRVAKSIAFASMEAVTDEFPFTKGLINNNKETAKELLATITGSKQSLNRLRGIQERYIFKPVNNILRGLQESLRSGEFYSQEREQRAQEEAAAAMLGDLLNDDTLDMTDGEEMLDSDGNPDDSIAVRGIPEVTRGDVVVATSVGREIRGATNSIASALVQSANAEMVNSRMIGNLNLQESKTQSLFLREGFTQVATGLNTIIDFNNKVLFTHAKNSLDFYKSVDQNIKEISAILKEQVEMQRFLFIRQKNGQQQQNDDAVFGNGGFNLKAYLKNVQEKTEKMDFGNITQMLQLAQAIPLVAATLAANPLHAATKGLASMFMGNGVKYAMRSLDESIQGAIHTGLFKLSEYGNKGNGFLGKLAQLFGYQEDKTKLEHVDISRMYKGPRQWDGQDHVSLTEVIPNYLSRIEASLTGNAPRVFNLDTNKWTDANSIKIEQRKMEKRETQMAVGNVGYEILNAMRSFVDTTDHKSNAVLKENISKFLEGVVQHGGFDPEHIQNAENNEYGTLNKVLLQLIESNKEIGKSLVHATGRIQNIRHEKNKMYREANEDEMDFISKKVAMGSQKTTFDTTNLKNPMESMQDNFSRSTTTLVNIENILMDIRDSLGGARRSKTRLTDSGNKLSESEESEVISPRSNIPPGGSPPGGGPPSGGPLGSGPSPSNRIIIKDPDASPIQQNIIPDELIGKLNDPQKIFLNELAAKTFGDNVDSNSPEFYDNLQMLNSLMNIGAKKNTKHETSPTSFDAFNDADNYDTVADLERYRGVTKEFLNAIGMKIDNDRFANDNRYKVGIIKLLNEIRDKQEGDMISTYGSSVPLDQRISVDFTQAENDKDLQNQIMAKIRENQATMEENNRKRRENGKGGMFSNLFSNSAIPNINNYLSVPYAGFDENATLIDQLAKAATIGEKMSVLSYNTQKIFQAPRSILTNVIMSADNMIYDFLFAKDTGEVDSEGKPIKGLFKKMVSEVDKTMEVVNDKLNDIFQNREKYADKANDFIKEWFGIDVKKNLENAKEKLTSSFVDPLKQGASSAFGSIRDDITSAFKGTAADLGFDPYHLKNEKVQKLKQQLQELIEKTDDEEKKKKMIEKLQELNGRDIETNVKEMQEQIRTSTDTEEIKSLHNIIDQVRIIASQIYEAERAKKEETSINNARRRQERAKEKKDKKEGSDEEESDGPGPAESGSGEITDAIKESGDKQQDALKELGEKTDETNKSLSQIIRSVDLFSSNINELITAIRNTSNNSTTSDAKEDVSKAEGHAFGRFGGSSGLAFISPGETVIDKYGKSTKISHTQLTKLPDQAIVLPSTFGKAGKSISTIQQQAANESHMKNSIMQKLDSPMAKQYIKSIPGYAEGNLEGLTPDQYFTIIGDIIDKNISDDDDKERIKNIVINIASKDNTENEEENSKRIADLLNAKAGDAVKSIGQNRTMEDVSAIIDQLYETKAAREDDKLRNKIKSISTSAGLSKTFGTEEEIQRRQWEGKNSNFGMIKSFMYQAFGTNPEKAASDLQKGIIKNTPEIMKGGALGAIAGTMFPLGGPLFGAIAGIAGELLKKNDTFMGFLFGDKLKDGTRKDNGLFSHEFMDSLQRYLPDMKKYGTVGAIAGLVTPFGPLGGVMAGIAASYIKNNEKAHNFFFGDKEGLLNKDRKAAIKKAFPNIAAGVLGTLLLGPFGVMGNAAVGAGLGLISTTETFKNIMLGKKDKNGERYGGIAGAIRRHFVNPFKNYTKDLGKKLRDWTREAIVEPMKKAFTPMGKYMIEGGKGLLKKAAKLLDIRIFGKGTRFDRFLNSVFGGATHWITSPLASLGELIGGKIKQGTNLVANTIGNYFEKKNMKKGYNDADYSPEKMNAELKRLGMENTETGKLNKAVLENSRKTTDVVDENGKKLSKAEVDARAMKAYLKVKDKKAFNEMYFNAKDDAIKDARLSLTKLTDHEHFYEDEKGNKIRGKLSDIGAKVHTDLTKLYTKLLNSQTGLDAFAANEEIVNYINSLDIVPQEREILLADLKPANDKITHLLKEKSSIEAISDDEIKEQEKKLDKARYSDEGDSEEKKIEKYTRAIRMIDNADRNREREYKEKFGKSGVEAQKRTGAGEEGLRQALTEEELKSFENIERGTRVLEGIFKLIKGEDRETNLQTILTESVSNGLAAFELNKAKMQADTLVAASNDYVNSSYIDKMNRYDKFVNQEGAKDVVENGISLNTFNTMVSSKNPEFIKSINALSNAKKDKQNIGIIKDLEKIMKMDDDKGTLIKRVTKLTLYGYTIEPDDYETIMKYSKKMFSRILELASLHVVFDDFSVFEKFKDDKDGRLDYLVELAKAKIKEGTDENGNLAEISMTEKLAASDMVNRILDDQYLASVDTIGQGSIQGHIDRMQDIIVGFDEEFNDEKSMKATERQFDRDYATSTNINKEGNTIAESNNKMTSEAADKYINESTTSKAKETSGHSYGIEDKAKQLADFAKSLVTTPISAAAGVAGFAANKAGIGIETNRTTRRIYEGAQELYWGAKNELTGSEERKYSREYIANEAEGKAVKWLFEKFLPFAQAYRSIYEMILKDITEASEKIQTYILAYFEFGKYIIKSYSADEIINKFKDKSIIECLKAIHEDVSNGGKGNIKYTDYLDAELKQSEETKDDSKEKDNQEKLREKVMNAKSDVSAAQQFAAGTAAAATATSGGTGFFSKAGDFASNLFGGNKKKDKDDKEEDKEEEKVKPVSGDALAAAATALGSAAEEINSSKGQGSIIDGGGSEGGSMVVSTPFGTQTYTKSGVDGKPMLERTKDNIEVQNKIEKDDERKSETLEALKEIAEILKDSLTGNKDGKPKKTKGLLDMLKDLAMKPLSMLASLLSGIPVIGSIAMAIFRVLSGGLSKIVAIFGATGGLKGLVKHVGKTILTKLLSVVSTILSVAGGPVGKVVAKALLTIAGGYALNKIFGDDEKPERSSSSSSWFGGDDPSKIEKDMNKNIGDSQSLLSGSSGSSSTFGGGAFDFAKDMAIYGIAGYGVNKGLKFLSNRTGITSESIRNAGERAGREASRLRVETSGTRAAINDALDRVNGTASDQQNQNGQQNTQQRRRNAPNRRRSLRGRLRLARMNNSTLWKGMKTIGSGAWSLISKHKGIAAAAALGGLAYNYFSEDSPEEIQRRISETNASGNYDIDPRTMKPILYTEEDREDYMDDADLTEEQLNAYLGYNPQQQYYPQQIPQQQYQQPPQQQYYPQQLPQQIISPRSSQQQFDPQQYIAPESSDELSTKTRYFDAKAFGIDNITPQEQAKANRLLQNPDITLEQIANRIKLNRQDAGKFGMDSGNVTESERNTNSYKDKALDFAKWGTVGLAGSAALSKLSGNSMTSWKTNLPVALAMNAYRAYNGENVGFTDIAADTAKGMALSAVAGKVMGSGSSGSQAVTGQPSGIVKISKTLGKLGSGAWNLISKHKGIAAAAALGGLAYNYFGNKKDEKLSDQQLQELLVDKKDNKHLKQDIMSIEQIKDMQQFGAVSDKIDPEKIQKLQKLHASGVIQVDKDGGPIFENKIQMMLYLKQSGLTEDEFKILYESSPENRILPDKYVNYNDQLNQKILNKIDPEKRSRIEEVNASGKYKIDPNTGKPILTNPMEMMQYTKDTGIENAEEFRAVTGMAPSLNTKLKDQILPESELGQNALMATGGLAAAGLLLRNKTAPTSIAAGTTATPTTAAQTPGLWDKAKNVGRNAWNLLKKNKKVALLAAGGALAYNYLNRDKQQTPTYDQQGIPPYQQQYSQQNPYIPQDNKTSSFFADVGGSLLGGMIGSKFGHGVAGAIAGGALGTELSGGDYGVGQLASDMVAYNGLGMVYDKVVHGKSFKDSLTEKKDELIKLKDDAISASKKITGKLPSDQQIMERVGKIPGQINEGIRSATARVGEFGNRLEQQAVKAGEAVAGKVDKVAIKGAELAERVGTAATNAKQTVVQGMERVGKIPGQINEGIRSATARVGEFSNRLEQQAVKAGEAVAGKVDKVATKGAELAERVGTAATNTKQTVVQGMERAGTSIIDTAGKVKSNVVEGTEKAITKVGDVTKEAGKLVSKIPGTIGEAASSTIDKGKQLGSDIISGVEKGASSIKTGVTNTAIRIEGKVETKIAEEMTKGRELLAQVKEKMSSLKKMITKYLPNSSMIKAVEGFCQKVLEHIAKPDIMKRALKAIGKSSFMSIPGVGLIVTAGFVAAGLADGYNNASKILEIPEGTATTGMKVYCGLVTALSCLHPITMIIAAFSDNYFLKKGIEWGISKLFGFDNQTLEKCRKTDVEEGAKDSTLFEDVKPYYDEFTNKAMSAIKGTVGAVIASAKSTGAMIADKAGKVASAVGETATSVADYIGEKASAVGTWMKENLNKGMDWISNKASNAWSTAKEIGSKAVEATKDFFKSIGNTASSIVDAMDPSKTLASMKGREYQYTPANSGRGKSLTSQLFGKNKEEDEEEDLFDFDDEKETKKEKKKKKSTKAKGKFGRAKLADSIPNSILNSTISGPILQENNPLSNYLLEGATDTQGTNTFGNRNCGQDSFFNQIITQGNSITQRDRVNAAQKSINKGYMIHDDGLDPRAFKDLGSQYGYTAKITHNPKEIEAAYNGTDGSSFVMMQGTDKDNTNRFSRGMSSNGKTPYGNPHWVSASGGIVTDSQPDRPEDIMKSYKASDIIPKTNTAVIMTKKGKAKSSIHDHYISPTIHSGKSKGKFGKYDIPGDTAENLQKRKDYIWAWLTDSSKGGLPPAGAAGIMGNIAVESGHTWSPNIVEGGGIANEVTETPMDGAPGFGIFQFTSGGNKQGLLDYAKKIGSSTSTLSTQLEFVKEYTTTGEESWTHAWDNAKQATDPGTACEKFMNDYERPGVPHAPERVDAANKIFNEYNGKTLSGIADPTFGVEGVKEASSSGTTQQSSGNANQQQSGSSQSKSSKSGVGIFRFFKKISDALSAVMWGSHASAEGTNESDVSTKTTSNNNTAQTTNSTNANIPSGGQGLKDVKETNLTFTKDTGSLGTPQYISIHHTGPDGIKSKEEAEKVDPSAEAINKMHQGPPNYWAGCGYHFVIRRDGSIERGTPEDKLGTHTWHHNTGTLGIHVGGHFDYGEPSEAQLASLTHLTGDLANKYKIPIDREHIKGHNEFPENIGETGCPGKNLLNKLDPMVNTLKTSAPTSNTTSTDSDKSSSQNKVSGSSGMEAASTSTQNGNMTTSSGKGKFSNLFGKNYKIENKAMSDDDKKNTMQKQIKGKGKFSNLFGKNYKIENKAMSDDDKKNTMQKQTKGKGKFSNLFGKSVNKINISNIALSEKSKIRTPNINKSYNGGNKVLITASNNRSNISSISSKGKNRISTLNATKAYGKNIFGKEKINGEQVNSKIGYGDPPEDNIKYVWTWLRNKDKGNLTEEQAAGVLGNIKVECPPCNPKLYEYGSNPADNGAPYFYLINSAEECPDLGDQEQAYGIFCFTNIDNTKVIKMLADWGSKTGKKTGTLSGQLEFAKETKSHAWDATRQAKTPEEAAEIFMNKFEVPAEDPNINQIVKRKQYANEYYNKFKGQTFDNIQDPTGSDIVSGQEASGSSQQGTQQTGQQSGSKVKKSIGIMQLLGAAFYKTLTGKDFDFNSVASQVTGGTGSGGMEAAASSTSGGGPSGNFVSGQSIDVAKSGTAAKIIADATPDWTTNQKPAKLSSRYGQRGSGFHAGVDIGYNPGTPLPATTDVKVTDVVPESESGGYGNAVIMQDTNSKYHIYAHLKPNSTKVKVGDNVKAGTIIAEAGYSGHCSPPGEDGTHLHYGIYESSNPGCAGSSGSIDPESYTVPTSGKGKFSIFGRGKLFGTGLDIFKTHTDEGSKEDEPLKNISNKEFEELENRYYEYKETAEENLKKDSNDLMDNEEVVESEYIMPKYEEDQSILGRFKKYFGRDKKQLSTQLSSNIFDSNYGKEKTDKEIDEKFNVDGFKLTTKDKNQDDFKFGKVKQSVDKSITNVVSFAKNKFGKAVSLVGQAGRYLLNKLMPMIIQRFGPMAAQRVKVFIERNAPRLANVLAKYDLYTDIEEIFNTIINIINTENPDLLQTGSDLAQNVVEDVARKKLIGRGKSKQLLSHSISKPISFAKNKFGKGIDFNSTAKEDAYFLRNSEGIKFPDDIKKDAGKFGEDEALRDKAINTFGSNKYGKNVSDDIANMNNYQLKNYYLKLGIRNVEEENIPDFQNDNTEVVRGKILNIVSRFGPAKDLDANQIMDKNLSEMNKEELMKYYTALGLSNKILGDRPNFESDDLSTIRNKIKKLIEVDETNKEAINKSNQYNFIKPNSFVSSPQQIKPLTGNKGIFGNLQNTLTSALAGAQQALADELMPAISNIKQIDLKELGLDGAKEVFGDDFYPMLLGGFGLNFGGMGAAAASTSNGNMTFTSGGGTNSLGAGNIAAASQWANSVINGSLWYGNNGCTEFVRQYLLRAGSPMGQLMTDCSSIQQEVTEASNKCAPADQGHPDLMWVPTIEQWAKMKGLFKPMSAGGAEGDIAIVNNSGHVIIADGKGGAWGNSSGSGCILHYDSIESAYPGTCVGYVSTGSGGGTVSQATGPLRSKEEMLADGGSTNAAGLGLGKGKYGQNNDRVKYKTYLDDQRRYGGGKYSKKQILEKANDKGNGKSNDRVKYKTYLDDQRRYGGYKNQVLGRAASKISEKTKYKDYLVNQKGYGKGSIIANILGKAKNIISNIMPFKNYGKASENPIDIMSANQLQNYYNALDKTDIIDENIPDFEKDDLGVIKDKIKMIEQSENNTAIREASNALPSTTIKQNIQQPEEKSGFKSAISSLFNKAASTLTTGKSVSDMFADSAKRILGKSEESKSVSDMFADSAKRILGKSEENKKQEQVKEKNKQLEEKAVKAKKEYSNAIDEFIDITNKFWNKTKDKFVGYFKSKTDLKDATGKEITPPTVTGKESKEEEKKEIKTVKEEKGSVIVSPSRKITMKSKKPETSVDRLTTQKDETVGKLKAPNGKTYDEKDIEKLTSKGLTKEQAIEVLKKDKKYAKDLNANENLAEDKQLKGEKYMNKMILIILLKMDILKNKQ